MTDAYSRIYNSDPEGQAPDAYSLPAFARNSPLKQQTVTTYTLTTRDNGRTLTFNNADGITITIPAGLSSSFVCTIVQLGTGQITVSPGASVTLNAYNALYHTAGRYAAVTLQAVAANSLILTGNTA